MWYVGEVFSETGFVSPANLGAGSGMVWLEAKHVQSRPEVKNEVTDKRYAPIRR